MHFLLKPSALLKSLGSISNNSLKKRKWILVSFPTVFDMECGQKLHGEKVRTWFGDVDEVRPSRGSECMVHVLAECRHHEEFYIEPLGVAVRLLL